LALTGAGNSPFGVLTPNHGVTGFLEALRTEGLAKIHTEPTITTLSGKPAYIISGGESPILTSSGQGSPSVTYKQFGTVVNFLPIVMGDGKIHLEVRPEVSQLDAASGIFIAGVTPTSVPGFAIRSAQAAAVLEDGQTLAIGGIIQTTQDTTLNKVPIIGDLPYLGHFFRAHSSRETEEELLILVTPRLVHPMDCAQLPKYLPGRETRTPDDFELFLEGIMEAPRGQREVLPAAHLVGSTAGMYPCGDASCGIGGRFCGRLGCRSCGSVIHTQPAAVPPPPTVQPQPLTLPPGGPGVSQGLRPVGLPVDDPNGYVVQPTAPQAATERPTHATPIPPRELTDWPTPNPDNLVPPVSELRRDLN
jgi:pilus assembly protein CpaC